MARPQSNDLTLTECPGRPRPWRVRWRETTRAGERLRPSKFFATQAEAEAFKAIIEQAAAEMPARPPTLNIPAAPPAAIVDALRHAPRGSLTFRAFAKGWLEDIVARKKPATARSYRGLLQNHIYPTIGQVRVSPATLGAEQIVAVISARAAAGVGWGTQKAILRALSTCLRWAVKYGHLTSNPCHGLLKDLKDDSDPVAYAEPEPNPLSAAEADAFLHWLQTGQVPGAPADRPVDGPRLRGGQLRSNGYPEWYPYFLTLVRTGMRRGEASGLKWATVYLEGARGPRARLESSYSPSARTAAAAQGKTSTGDGTLKSKKAREITIAAKLAAILGELARTRRAEAMKRGRPASAYVFVNARGQRILSDNKAADRIFAAGMIAIGIEAAGHTIHDLRDTFATSHLQEDPGRLFWVSAMLGHRQTSTTLNRYTKWVPSMTGADFASALDAPGRGDKAQEGGAK